MQGDEAENAAAGLQPPNGEAPFLRRTFWGFTLGDAAHARKVVRMLPWTFAPGDGYVVFSMDSETKEKITKRQGPRYRGAIATAKRPDAVLAEGLVLRC